LRECSSHVLSKVLSYFSIFFTFLIWNKKFFFKIREKMQKIVKYEILKNQKKFFNCNPIITEDLFHCMINDSNYFNIDIELSRKQCIFEKNVSNKSCRIWRGSSDKLFRFWVQSSLWVQLDSKLIFFDGISYVLLQICFLVHQTYDHLKYPFQMWFCDW